MKLFKRIKARFSESAWAPLAPKIVFGFLALVALGVVGSGALDHLFASRAAHASDAERAHPGAASVSGALGLTVGSAAPSADASGGSASASPSTSASAASPEPSTSSEVPRADGKIVLNSASESDLEKLPGIGPSKAKKIVELREKIGHFKRLEDLYRIKGIKRKLIEKIRPLVVLDPESTAPTP